MYDEDFLNAIALVSFMVGIANYNENLTQNDKADLMRGLDQQTSEILSKLHEAIEKQNEMLIEILQILRDQK